MAKSYLDIFFIHLARQFGCDFVGPIGLDDVDYRDRTESCPGSSGDYIQERLSMGGRWASAKEVLDKTVHFPPNALKTSGLRGGGRLKTRFFNWLAWRASWPSRSNSRRGKPRNLRGGSDRISALWKTEGRWRSQIQQVVQPDDQQRALLNDLTSAIA